MKDHLKELLIKSFDDELTEKENNELQKGFVDFPELLLEKEEISLLRNTIQNQKYTFNYGFSDRVMRKIESLSTNKQNLQDYFTSQLSSLFRWVAPIGIAAILLIVITIYFTQDSVYINAISGENNLTLNDAITLTFYNY